MKAKNVKPGDIFLLPSGKHIKVLEVHDAGYYSTYKYISVYATKKVLYQGNTSYLKKKWRVNKNIVKKDEYNIF